MDHVKVSREPEVNLQSAGATCVELEQIQRQLDKLRARLAPSEVSHSCEPIDDLTLGRLAKEIVRCRRRRDSVFGGELFGEPAWDILLELFASEWSEQKLSVSGACYASGVPPTTGLRWLLRLEKEGWVQRRIDPYDGRRSWVALTDRGLDMMRSYLKRMTIRAV